MVQKLAHRSWHQIKRQEELLTGEGEEVGDGRAEGLSANEDGGKLQFHSHLTLMESVLPSSKVHNLKACM